MPSGAPLSNQPARVAASGSEVARPQASSTSARNGVCAGAVRCLCRTSSGAPRTVSTAALTLSTSLSSSSSGVSPRRMALAGSLRPGHLAKQPRNNLCRARPTWRAPCPESGAGSSSRQVPGCSAPLFLSWVPWARGPGTPGQGQLLFTSPRSPRLAGERLGGGCGRRPGRGGEGIRLGPVKPNARPKHHAFVCRPCSRDCLSDGHT